MQHKVLIAIVVLASQVGAAAQAGDSCQLPPPSSLPPPPLPGGMPNDWPAELKPYIPSSLSDTRLRQDLIVVPGSKQYASALEGNYALQLRRYAQSLISKKQFKQAAAILDQAIKSTSRPEALARQLRAETNLSLADDAPLSHKKILYQKALDDATILAKEYVAEPYIFIKTRALIGLGTAADKSEAVKCLSEAYSYSQIFGYNTAKLSGYLLQLTGKSKPEVGISQRDADKVRRVILALNKSTAPTKAEVTELLKTEFSQRTDRLPDLIFNSRKQSDLFSEIWFEQSRVSDKATSVSVFINPSTAALTKPMVEKWLPLKEGNKIIQPWGTTEVQFNYPGNLATIFTITWNDSLDAAAKQKTQDAAARVSESLVPDPPTLDRFRPKIDKLIYDGRYKEALQLINIALSWVGMPASKETKATLRPQLVRIKEGELKSKQATYLKEAPFAQIAQLLERIQRDEITDFLTPEEYAARKYFLTGKMSKDYQGNCEIKGGRDFETVYISGKTDATEKLFAALKITVPFDYNYTYLKIAPPPGLLIDDVLDQQRERDSKANEQLGEPIINALPEPPAPSNANSQ